MTGNIKEIKGKALPMVGDDIDTDRIIPARFLRCVTFDGLGEQAFRDERFDDVIAESFAEIFYGNSSVLGLVCITLPKNEIAELASYIENNPNTEVVIDIEKAEIKAGDKSYKAGIKPTLQKSLLDGTYDTIYELMKNKDKIEELDKNLPPKCFN